MCSHAFIVCHWLLIPSGPPGHPGDFKVQVTNLTALTLTWTAPWSHPISNYIVAMLNLSSGQQEHWTTTKEQSVLRGGGGESQCHSLQFTVKAVTVVGSSSDIPPIQKGFPMGMQFAAVQTVHYCVSLCSHESGQYQH